MVESKTSGNNFEDELSNNCTIRIHDGGGFIEPSQDEWTSSSASALSINQSCNNASFGEKNNQTEPDVFFFYEVSALSFLLIY